MGEPEAKASLKEEYRVALADLVEVISPSDYGYEDFILQSLYRAQKVLRDNAPACEHEWHDARSSIIESGEFCIKCGKLRPGNQMSEANGSSP